jgi:hypothetical protein
MEQNQYPASTCRKPCGAAAELDRLTAEIVLISGKTWTLKATQHLLAEFAVGVPMHPPIAENQAEVILPVVFAPFESSPFFGVFVQTWTKYPNHN